MVLLFDFFEWMQENTSLSDSSVAKYESAVRVVSNEMKRKGVIPLDLSLMSLLQLDVFIPIILKDDYFVSKNKKGNNMYSNALKQYRLYKNVVTNESFEHKEIIDAIDGYNSLKETEKDAIVKSRVGQGLFRKKILEKYKNVGCIITGIKEKRLLIASHVKPWAACSNQERLSEENGLLLTPTYDKLFDSGLISFSDSGEILVSSILSNDVVEKLELKRVDFYNIKASQELKKNLEYHRDVIFFSRKNKKEL